MAARLDGSSGFDLASQLLDWENTTARNNAGRLPVAADLEFSRLPISAYQLELLHAGFLFAHHKDRDFELLMPASTMPRARAVASGRSGFAELLAAQPALPEDKASLRLLKYGKTTPAKPKSH